MKARLEALALQRAQLLKEIDEQRAQLHARAKSVRQELAYAGLGLVVARLLARRPWLRAVALAAVALAANHLRTTSRGMAAPSD